MGNYGSCAFDSVEAYFKQEKALFESLSLPNEQLSRKELFQWMKQHNPQLKELTFRLDPLMNYSFAMIASGK